MRQPTDAIIHDFAERLEWSAELSDEPSWADFYRKLWPDMIACLRIDKDSKWQRWGVDREIVLPNRHIYIDEKKREKDWGDVLLEEWSVCDYDPRTKKILRGRKVGWALDGEKQCDYVAYAIPSAGKCYMLPFELLRYAFADNLAAWHAIPRFNPTPARNDGYWTANVAVPWPALKMALTKAMERQFGCAAELPPALRLGNQLVFNWAETLPPAGVPAV